MKSDKATAKESAPAVRKDGTLKLEGKEKTGAKAAKAPVKSVAKAPAKSAAKAAVKPEAKAPAQASAAKKPAAKAAAPAPAKAAAPRKRAAPVPAGLDPATLIGPGPGAEAAMPPEGAVSPLLEASLAGTAAMLAEPLQAGVGEAVQVVAAVAMMEESERRARIAVEAYLIAESRGFPPGREEAHWLEAEEKLFGAR